MSVENRKRMYDELVAKHRFADIPDDMRKEFGDPAEPVPVKEPEVMHDVKPAPKKVAVPGQHRHKGGRR